MPAHLSHALLVLATYWPNIWPSQERLARDMHTSKRNVNKRLDALEEAGLIVRLSSRGRSTRYRLKLNAAKPNAPVSTSELQGTQLVNSSTLEEQEGENSDGWGF